MPALINDFIVPATWTQLSVVSQLFGGTITSKNTNTGTILFRGRSLPSMNGAVVSGEYLPVSGPIVDLADIEVQCAGVANQVLKIYGVIYASTPPLVNLV